MAKATKTKSKTTKAKATKAAKPAAKKATKKAPPVRRKHDREKLMAQVVKLRERNVGWAEIAAETGADAGICRLVFMQSQVKPKERIKGTDAEVAAAIVEGRDELNESWGRLAARSGLPQGKVQRLYTEATGRDWRQGYAAVQARVAERGDAPAKKKASKSKSEKTASSKSKRKAVQKGRKAKSGSSNPS